MVLTQSQVVRVAKSTRLSSSEPLTRDLFNSVVLEPVTPELTSMVTDAVHLLHKLKERVSDAGGFSAVFDGAAIPMRKYLWTVSTLKKTELGGGVDLSKTLQNLTLDVSGSSRSSHE